jgi:hypothetical protein
MMPADLVWVAARVVWVLFLLLVPTLFFHGLYWVLEALKDDELIDAITNGSPREPASAVAPADVLAGEESTVACPDCGAANRRPATYCYACLTQLRDGS